MNVIHRIGRLSILTKVYSYVNGKYYSLYLFNRALEREKELSVFLRSAYGSCSFTYINIPYIYDR